MGFVWRVPPERAWGDLANAYAQSLRDGIYQLAQHYEPLIQGWMQENAAWEDRTSNARQTLSAEVERLAEAAVEILMAHGMDYGIFLELAHGGRWAIIGPAVDEFAPRIWADVVEMLR